MTEEDILRRRMHGLYVSRRCGSLETLAHELLGLHCWFHRNVVFSALIRGADLQGWKTALTKTWIHHALHGAVYEDLPDLLTMHARCEPVSDFECEVLRCMEDGVFSRAEFRRIFAHRYDERFIERAFSPWGGVFVGLAQRGLVAFRDMTSRDFDLIGAEPARTKDEVLPDLFRQYIAAYGPATKADAAWFLGLHGEDAGKLAALSCGGLCSFELNKKTYFYDPGTGEPADIPEITLLSGFDPLIVSYADRSAVLPPEYRNRVIMKSGICMPSVAVNGRVAGLWNIRKDEPVLEFFSGQPERIENAAREMAESVCRRSKQYV